MAYLFNTLSDAPDEQEKYNIFQQQQTNAAANSGASSGNIQKGSTSTSAPSTSGASSSSPSVQVSTQKQAGYNPQASASAYQQASATMNLPAKSLQKAESALSAGEQSLQAKANAYQTSAQTTGQGYKLDEKTLQGAASGDEESYKKAAGRLGGSSPALFGNFEGLGSDQPNIDYIRDPGSLYRAEAGPNYGGGQSRLDASMLRNNPEFKAQQAALLGREKALRERNAKEQEDQSKTAHDYLTGAYDTSTADIRRQLGGYGDRITEDAKAAAEAENTRRGALDPRAVPPEEKQAMLDQIKKDLSVADPHSEAYRSLKYLNDQYDLGDYQKVNKDTKWQDYLTPEKADRYNRVQGLLGNADMYTASQAGPAAETSFDRAGAQKSLMEQLRAKRVAADIAGQQKLDAIQAGATGRLNEYQTALKDRITKQNQAMGGAFGDPNYVANATPSSMDQDEGTDWTWQDMLSADDISGLNETQADLGVLNPTAYADTGRVSGKESRLALEKKQMADIEAQVAAKKQGDKTAAIAKATASAKEKPVTKFKTANTR